MPSPVTVQLPRVERYHLGPGAISLLGSELETLGVERGLLLTGATLSRGRLVKEVREAAAGRLGGEFAGVVAHNPTSAVEAALASFESHQADALVAFGGGSVVDCAKAVAHRLGSAPPIVNLATTLGGAEFACSYGETNDETLVKGGYRDPSLFARAVFLDPHLTEETPLWLWNATGMRAVDHAVEAIFAENAHPYLDALALEALRLLAGPHGALGLEPLDQRMRCLNAAWMAHSGSLHIQWGLSHQMGRQLGPRFAIPHGYTSAICLPAVVEAETPRKREQEAALAGALGGPPGSAAESLRRLVARLHLPSTLGAAGIQDRAAVEELFAGNLPALEVVARVW